MPKWEHNIRAGVLMALVACRALAQCGSCEAPRNKISVDPETFVSRVEKYRLPELKGKLMQNPPEEPLRLDVTVGMDGKPCDVVVVGAKSGDVEHLVRTAVKTWTFRPTVYEGRKLCLYARLLFYVRRIKGELKLVVPGLRDAGAKE